MRTFVFKAYASKRNRKLHKQIDVASHIWNHCIALHKRYYRLFKKHLNVFVLKKHVTKLKKRKQYQHWNQLGSQAVQDVVIRIDKGYKLFFNYLKTRQTQKQGRIVRPPSFRKRINYQSFTLTQAGYSLFENRLIVGKQQYRFHKSREIEGQIKTLTIKRDNLGDTYFIFVTDAEIERKANTATTEIAGIDFGLKTYLVISDGTEIIAPEPLKRSLKQLKKANRSLSRKKKCSNHRKAARRTLGKLHRKIANQRKDFQFKAAKILASRYKNIAIEDLDLVGMKTRWGRKVSDLGFATFVSILEHQASKTGCTVVKIDRWYPSSKECHSCGVVNQDLGLRDREWTCVCGATHNRDLNAAINIQRAGTSVLGLGNVRPVVIPAVAV